MPETLTESRVFFFPRAAFIDLVAKNPALALNMMRSVSRLRRLTNLVEDLSSERSAWRWRPTFYC